MWMHLFALWALRDLAGLPISPWAVLIFVFGGSLLAAVNHTRIEVKIPYLFNSLEHDTHHRFSSYNYAQYTQLFDWMVGTFKEWSEPPALPQRATPAPPLATLPSCPKGDAPAVCVVTGGSGLVGARLVAMLLERGAQRVLSLDLTLPPPLPPSSPRLRHAVCDITSAAAEEELAGHFEGASAVFHCAALVGPGFPAAAYWAVNAGGTAAVTAAAARAGVRVLVLTSSPTILLKGGDVRNAGEADLVAPATPQEHLHEYSRSKAEGTWAGLRAARAAGIAACAVAPHQVYGPRDRLFLPALLRAARGGLLRVFGPGDNLISLCHVDNCAHAHILAAGALRRGDRGVEGELFLVTDTGAVYLWDAISAAAEQCGLGSLENRCHLSPPLLYAAAYASAAVSAVMTAVAGGRSTTFTPFAVRMLLIDRWFDVSKAVKRLGYRPLVSFQREWPRVVAAAWERIQEGQPAALEVGTAAAAAVPPAVGAPCAALKGRSSSAAKRRSYP
jgi:nucleoside-diphosphate-sugar epimerase